MFRNLMQLCHSDTGVTVTQVGTVELYEAATEVAVLIEMNLK